MHSPDETIRKFVEARSITLEALAQAFVSAQNILSQSLALNKIWMFHDDKPQKESIEFFEYIQKLPQGITKTILLWLAYQLGLGVEKNLVLARSFYQAVIRPYNQVPIPIVAMICSFAYMLQRSEGRTTDIKGARTLSQQAAELDDPVAMTNLAYMFYHGEGGTTDVKRARKLYQQAAELGDPKAMNNLAIMLMHGEGGAKDLEGTRSLFQQAVELGYPVAMANFAYMLYHGEGGARDAEGARKLCQQAAELGISAAMNNLANILQYSEDGTKGFPQRKMFSTLFYTFENYSTLSYPEDKAAIAYIIQQLLQGKGAFVKPAIIQENKQAIKGFLLAIINQKESLLFDFEQHELFIAKVYVAAQIAYQMAYKMHKTKQQRQNIPVFLPIQQVNKDEVVLLAKVLATNTGLRDGIPQTVTEILAAVEKNFFIHSSSAATKEVSFFQTATTTVSRVGQTDEPDVTGPSEMQTLLNHGL